MMKAMFVSLAALVAAAPAVAQDRWDRTGGRDYRVEVRLAGAGVRLLDPQLRDDNRGRAFVLANFDRNGDRLIQPREAQAANAAFAQVAGRRGERFDWAAHDIGLRAPAPRWNAAAMRGYGFRQTDRGATLSLQDEVLFATDSATLRPGAIDRLRTLADYLRAERGVRIAIEGHTDARGSDAHNQALSLRRADAVRAAFDQLGVTRARFVVDGRGERQPVASNVTAAGQRQNRRVEITLLGQRADRFAGR